MLETNMDEIDPDLFEYNFTYTYILKRLNNTPVEITLEKGGEDKKVTEENKK